MSSYASGFPQSGDSYEEPQQTESPTQERDQGLQDEDANLDEAGEPKKIEPLLDGLTPDLEKKLISLVEQFEQESYPVWRFINRDCFQAESFWKDLQNGFYDAQGDIWRVPGAKDIAKVGESGQRFTYQTNMYRALGQSIVSAIGQKMPTTRWLATDFRRESDILAAKSAGVVAPLIERNNKIALLNVRAAYLLYTHGSCSAYVRYLEDSERFGWKEVPQMAMQEAILREAGYECFDCAQFSPQMQNQDPMQAQQPQGQGGTMPSSPSGGPDPAELSCQGCGRPLSEINYRPPEYGEVPVEIGTQLVPRGQEVISLHGDLETRRPPWCQDFEDYPYFGLVHEVHVSSLRGTYGARAQGLQGGWGSGPYDTWDRFARLALVEPTVSYYGTSNQNLVTFKRYWLKPSTFWMCDKKDRVALLDIFPDGAYLAFADSKKLLDARNERMGNHIRVCHAVEGPGAYTPAMGSSVISVQQRFNTIGNFIMEWVEYAAAGAGMLVNANVINYKALKSHRRAPGMIYPIRMAVGQNLSAAVYESRPGQIAGEIFKYGQDLRSLGEFLSGAVPTVSGGTEMSLKPTTYISDKESALGRLYTAWLHLRMFWADVMALGVREFAKWRTEDEQYTAFGPDGSAQGKIIRLADLQGNFDAYPETNEQFPVLWQQMQSTYMQLVQMATADERVGEIIGDLENVQFSKAMLGLPDLYVPGEDDRLKQKHEIALLLQQKPIVQIVMGPQGPQQQVLPSIGIDQFEDMHPVHEDTVKKWAVSAEGLKAKIENPLGYKNVIAHGVMHEQFRLGELAQSQAATGMHQPTGKGGGPSGGGGNLVGERVRAARERRIHHIPYRSCRSRRSRHVDRHRRDSRDYGRGSGTRSLVPHDVYIRNAEVRRAAPRSRTRHRSVGAGLVSGVAGRLTRQRGRSR